MSSKSEQHKKFIGMILITHPLLNEAQPFEVRIEALERERDENGDLIELDDNGKLVQTTHASIIRLFSKWDGNYVLEGFDKLVKEVIPALNKAYTQLAGQVVDFTWKDNLAFRKMIEVDGKIYGSSGNYNPATGEWENEWLTQEWFDYIQKCRQSPLFFTYREDLAPIPSPKKEVKPIDLSFLQAPTVATSAKKAKK